MGKPLSMDLRERVVGAISGGMSRRAAAARFGVSTASAVRWAALQRDRGRPAAKPQGRDPRSATTEAEAVRIWAPHGHWMTTTFVGGLRLSGITAPLVIDRPMTGAWFDAWVARALAPTLKPGDVVILDNLPAHKTIAARDAIKARGARLLFLPPYSPDFNPIENAFAKLKALLRKAAARTADDLSRAIGSAIDTFTPTECANYLAAAGYDAY